MDTATYIGAGGLLATATRAQCRVEADGLLVEPQATNRVLHSSTEPTWSTVGGGGTIVTGDTNCPLDPGGYRMTSVTWADHGSHGIYSIASGGNSHQASVSVYVALYDSDTPTVIDLFATGDANVELKSMTLSATPTRLYGTSYYYSGGFFNSPYLAANAGATTCLRFAESKVQYEIDQPYTTSYIPTAGSAVTRPVDAISLPNKIPSGVDYYIGLTAKPENGRAWTQAANTNVFSVGTLAAANSASLYEDHAGNIVFNVLDAASGANAITYAHSFAAGSGHRLVAGWRAGAPVLYVDGVGVGTVSGAGTGVATMPATVYLGSGNASGTGAFGGNLKAIKICTQLAKCL